MARFVIKGDGDNYVIVNGQKNVHSEISKFLRAGHSKCTTAEIIPKKNRNEGYYPFKSPIPHKKGTEFDDGTFFIETLLFLKHEEDLEVHTEMLDLFKKFNL